MKIVVLNGSPRKKWNTSQVLNSFKEGVIETNQNITIKEINLYDYKFTGCRSCFACKLKRFEDLPLECRINDDIHDLLVECRNADAIIIGSPIYFLDLSAQLKAFLERLMYPGKSSKTIPCYILLTMNATEEAYEKAILPSVNVIVGYWNGNFGYTPKVTCFYDTYQRDSEEIYKKSSHDMSSKKIRHDAIWKDELLRAKEAGKKFMKEVM